MLAVLRLLLACRRAISVGYSTGTFEDGADLGAWLVQRFQRPVRALVRRHGSWASANPWVSTEDWEAEAWEALWRVWCRYPDVGEVDRGNMAIRGVRNALVNLAKRSERHARSRASRPLLSCEVGGEVKHLETVEFRMALVQVWGHLDRPRRQLLELISSLVWHYDITTKAALNNHLANMLGCCPDTARVRIHALGRALQRLDRPVVTPCAMRLQRRARSMSDRYC